MPRVTSFISAMILSQQGHLFLWVPVCFAIGIGGFFSLRIEPQASVYWAALSAFVALLIVKRFQFVGRALIIGILAMAVGFVLASVRSHSVAETRLGFRYYGPVEGRIVGIDRSASDAVRLSLDRVVLFDMSPARTPTRIRVALHGDQEHFEPLIGETIVLAAHLSPPSGPVEPGGFDFQRHAWFQKLGAVGYTRSPIMVLLPANDSLVISRIRQQISNHIRLTLPDNSGGFAAAVVTGDRSGIDQSSLDSLRDSNLAHLLAISGLHMGMLTGFIFALVRGGLALFPVISMRVPAKKCAAVSALVVASGYLALSGGAIATERAYIMVAVALIAILLDRRAISLRAVAVAALVVLILTPGALVSPGFQMSFAATTALVAVFTEIRDREWIFGPKWLRPIIATILSSAIAGLATAPFGAAHFNQISQMGLIANVLSVPAMGIIVVPGGVLAALLSPFGGSWIGLNIMGFGLDWIMMISDWVSGFNYSVRMVPQPNRWVLPLFALGALWTAFWQGHARNLGVVAFSLAAVLWSKTERPYILISDNGGLVGVMHEGGRALSKPRGSGFVAGVWLENDGDAASQVDANTRWKQQVGHVTGRKIVEKLEKCGGSAILVVNAEPLHELPCLVISPKYLRETGSITISQTGDIRTSRQ
ncbi:MAG: ComEC/Rec2 family competence protein, partial [Paracoccaceae bacterium]|nr:ComEC/Rec2 family competence protein [Paracoccaceae bacterium]